MSGGEAVKEEETTSEAGQLEEGPESAGHSDRRAKSTVNRQGMVSHLEDTRSISYQSETWENCPVISGD